MSKSREYHHSSPNYIKDGKISMILAKVAEDILFTSDIPKMKEFYKLLTAKFKVSELLLDEDIDLNGCRTCQDKDGGIRMSMDDYMKRINPTEITRTHIKII